MADRLDNTGLAYFWSKLKTVLAGKASTDTATQSVNGLMSALDKSKLDSINDVPYSVVDLTIEGIDWEDNSPYTYEYENNDITSNSAVFITLKHDVSDIATSNIDWEKDTGIITFSTDDLPTGDIDLTILIIHSDPNSLLPIDASEVQTGSIEWATTVDGALETLMDEIGELDRTVNGYIEIIPTDVELSEFTMDEHYINPALGEWRTASNRGLFKSLVNCAAISFDANAGYDTQYAFLGSLNFTEVDADIVGGTLPAVAEAGESVEVDVPPGANYLYIRRIDGNGHNSEPSNVVFYIMSEDESISHRLEVVEDALDNKADKTTATSSADGLMSSADKVKLDTITAPIAAAAEAVSGNTSAGAVSLVKVGNMVFANVSFTANASTVMANNLFTIPSGYIPDSSYGTVRFVCGSDGNFVNMVAGTDGYIKEDSGNTSEQVTDGNTYYGQAFWQTA